MKVNEDTIKLWKIGYNNAVIARKFGVSPAFVSMVLNGKRNSVKAMQIRNFVQDLLRKQGEV